MFDTVELTDKLQADLGLRWDRIDVDYTTVSAAGVAAEFGRIDKALSGRAGLVYKPVDARLGLRRVQHLVQPVVRRQLRADARRDRRQQRRAAAGAQPQHRGRHEVGPHDRPVRHRWRVFHTEKTNAKTTDATTGATVLAGDQQVNGRRARAVRQPHAALGRCSPACR